MMQFIDLKKQYQLIEADIKKSIHAVLDHGQYIMGPEIDILEEQLASFVGVEHAIVNASGTDALLMALLALNIKPGDEIITSPFSFFATTEVMGLIQAKPVFVDIDPITYNIDANQIESAITPHTKAIMPVSLYGQCADMDPINRIAQEHGLAVIEDGAQSFGAKYKDQQSCGLSTIGCTSFFPSKPLGGYGDSGACFTNDNDLASRLREIRIHGQSARYSHTHIGINGRMDTIQAAILIQKLKLFPREVELRANVGKRYNQLLGSKCQTPNILPNHTHVFAQYTVEVEHRESIQSYLKEQGIPTAVHYPKPLHLQPAMKYLGYSEGDFPHAERAATRVLSLPMHPYLSESEQKTIVAQLEKAMASSYETV